MNDLSSDALALLRAGAKAAKPSAAERARLSEALCARLGDAAVLGEASVAGSSGLAGPVWVKVWAATVGLGLLVGGAVLALRPAATPSVAPVAQRAGVASPVAVVAPMVVEPQPLVAAAPAGEVALPKAAPAPRRSPDRLAQEVALLSRATSALRSGRPAEALKALSEHQSQFPKGALSEERRAARAQALCALGRRSEAQGDLATLARTGPQSPQAARARQVCGGAR